MRLVGLILRFATLARSGTKSLRPAALIAVVALAVALQGLGVVRATFGACCSRPGASESALSVADPICETSDPRGGAPQGHAEDAPCCLACPPSQCDKSAVAAASPVAALAPPIRGASNLCDGAGAGGLVHSPLGWMSSWSSRAPPTSFS